jgi:predicted DNA-binding protein
MGTDKKRLNITLTPELEEAIELMAEHESKPQATKARELLEKAVELEEEMILARIAHERKRESDGKYITHEELWEELIE